MAIRSPVINVMANAALKAARGLNRDFGEVEQLQVSVKGPSDFVSSADLRAERTLKTELQRARPGYGLLFEEGGAAEGTDPHHRWIVDPLDGTTNFLHGVPHFSISIALERDGEIVAGVIYDPTRDEMYWAEKGAGAYLNDRRLRVSARRQLGEALIATGLPFRGRPKHPAYTRDARPRDGGDQRGAPVRLGRARPRLCRRRTLRRLLGIRAVAVGSGGRAAAGARGRRLCQRPRRRAEHDDERRRARRERPSASAARGADQGGDAPEANRRTGA